MQNKTDKYSFILKPEVVFDFSVDDEIGRVKYTTKKNDWYKENGYIPKYPNAIEQKLESNGDVTEADIEKAVSDEFDKEEYDQEAAPICENWYEIETTFFKNLKTLNLPTQDRYHICLTKYGVGGSYGYPNEIQLNLGRKEKAHITIAHEIVHLTIEPLIKKYNIEHWTKERLVNLIINRFFPENQSLQKDPENAEQISEIFNKKFPDIKKIIKQVSELEKQNK